VCQLVSASFSRVLALIFVFAEVALKNNLVVLKCGAQSLDRGIDRMVWAGAGEQLESEVKK